ncbi:GumC family protein, partial [Christiangramia aquimixticola]|uniref:GumC family protein n=1 Tax=Christiangramia aquimixticola TaxID=1697558 RepID=UPI003AA9877B
MEDFNELPEEKKESNFDLKAEIYKYLNYWRWILIGFLIGGALAFLYNRYSIPKFKTQASLLIVDDDENGAMSALPSGGGAILSLDNEGLDSQIEKLKSKQLVSSVIDELDLNIQYFIEGNVITVEAYKTSPILIQFISPDSIVNKKNFEFYVTPTSDTNFRLEEQNKGYSSEHKIGEIIEFEDIQFTILPRSGNEEGVFKKSSTVNIRVLPLRYVADIMLANLSIMPKGKAKDMLELGIVNESSTKSEDFLNRLMARFNEEGIEDKQEVAQNTTAFIQERLEMITTELDSVEVGIADFKRQNEIMNIEAGAAQYQTKFSEVEQQIFELETQLELLNSVEELLKRSGLYDLLPEVGISDVQITGLINSYNTLVLERNQYLKGSTPDNPVVKAITEQLDSLRENLFENIASTRSSINIRLNELNQRGNIAQRKFSNFPGLEKGMRNIERQQQIKEQLYLFLLQRREEAAISYAATASVARVVDAAYTINEPVDPAPWLILIGGFLIGLVIPILIIFIKNVLDTKVHHKGDLTPLTDMVPFIGETPRIKNEESDVIFLNDRSPLAESFRILRTNLAYLIQKKQRNIGHVIFVTSTIKGEGKTFISYNLSRTLASTQKKVLLIGADIRNPKLHRYTSSTIGTKEKGLSDYLYNYEVNHHDIISNTADDNIKVDIILSGPIPPNPAELLMNDRMEELINLAKSEYDYVIVDTAPTMIVTDTLLISQLADYTLYVTRADYTEKSLLQFSRDLKKQGKLKGLAVILNDVDHSKFSYGAQYGYS